MFRKKIKTNSGIGTLIDNDGKFAEKDFDKAETLNSFFTSVFTKENKNKLPRLEKCSYSKGASITKISITPEAVKKKLQNLDPSKAQGPDGIPSKVLKELSEELSQPLSSLFNLSIETGVVPEDWRTANVVAIFKKGTKSDPGNYRPVSLTCIISKVLESLIRDDLVKYMTENELYSTCQHGFRQNRSCITQLLEVMDDFTKLLDKGSALDVIYLDFKKAFDTVPHERLLLKMKAYGICDKLLQWVRSFLSERKQRVRVGSEYSKKSDVLSGIPQGSILGPVLFTIFINDLPNSIESTCKIFADDTKIYNNTDENKTIQKDLNTLQKWTDDWNLYFNVSKCKVMHVGKNNPGREYVMKIDQNEQKITACAEEKDLGILFDEYLNFDKHIQKVINKANQMLGIIKRTFTRLDKETFLLLYKSLVRPHLEYGNIVWYPYLIRQSRSIEKVQRRATKAVRGCKELSYAERLRLLNLHSLKGRRIRGDIIQMYKIFNNLDKVNIDTLFTSSLYDKTRNQEGKLHVQRCITNKRQHYFINRVTNHWNLLTLKIKRAPSLNMFKNLLDKDENFKQLFLDFD